MYQNEPGKPIKGLVDKLKKAATNIKNKIEAKKNKTSMQNITVSRDKEGIRNISGSGTSSGGGGVYKGIGSKMKAKKEVRTGERVEAIATKKGLGGKTKVFKYGNEHKSNMAVAGKMLGTNEIKSQLDKGMKYKPQLLQKTVTTKAGKKTAENRRYLTDRD